jgi:SAM-dependent methyltransferase
MEKILNAMKDALKDCQSILDVGTGTGRFAQYFNEAGFTVIGIDISLSMMAQAREKGVQHLVRADVHHLPFRDESLDGSIMIHVLHLVKDWVQVIHEVGRVTKKMLLSEAGDTEGFSVRQKYLELRAEMGHPLSRFNEAEFGLRKRIRPRFIVSAGDYWTDVNADEEIRAFEARKSSIMWDVPKDVHENIMRRLHREYGGKTLKRHNIPEVVGWDPAMLREFKK